MQVVIHRTVSGRYKGGKDFHSYPYMTIRGKEQFLFLFLCTEIGRRPKFQEGMVKMVRTLAELLLPCSRLHS